ncbi:hypothetical protein ACS0TY_031465 [Phlomoides rotata]
MGLGIIIHDSYGRHIYIYSRSHVMSGLYQPEEDEAIGLHEALSWIKDLSMHRVVIEMDVKFVVDAMNRDERLQSTYEDIVAGCRGVEINRGSPGAIPPVEAHQYIKETSHT